MPQQSSLRGRLPIIQDASLCGTTYSPHEEERTGNRTPWHSTAAPKDRVERGDGRGMAPVLFDGREKEVPKVRETFVRKRAWQRDGRTGQPKTETAGVCSF